jgi:hypothetical protein
MRQLRRVKQRMNQTQILKCFRRATDRVCFIAILSCAIFHLGKAVEEVLALRALRANAAEALTGCVRLDIKDHFIGITNTIPGALVQIVVNVAMGDGTPIVGAVCGQDMGTLKIEEQLD